MQKLFGTWLVEINYTESKIKAQGFCVISLCERIFLSLYRTILSISIPNCLFTHLPQLIGLREKLSLLITFIYCNICGSLMPTYYLCYVILLFTIAAE